MLFLFFPCCQKMKKHMRESLLRVREQKDLGGECSEGSFGVLGQNVLLFRVKYAMAQHHLQFHGQLRGNHKKPRSSSSGSGHGVAGGPWLGRGLQLKKLIAEKNSGSKQLCSHLVLQPQLHADLKASPRWVYSEPLQQCQHLGLSKTRGNFPDCELVVKKIPSLQLEIPQVPATRNKPLNDLQVPIVRCPPQWRAIPVVNERGVNTVVKQQNSNRREVAV